VEKGIALKKERSLTKKSVDEVRKRGEGGPPIEQTEKREARARGGRSVNKKPVGGGHNGI